MVDRAINLGAGPSQLPPSVLTEAQAGLLNYGGTHMGITELSHRGTSFMSLSKQAELDLRQLLAIPSDYHVLWMQGGGLSQFSMVVLNLLAWYRLHHQLDAAENPPCDYIISGSWTSKAAGEARRLGANVNVVVDGRKASADGKTFGDMPPTEAWSYTSADAPLKPAFIYYCANETVNGVETDPPVVPEHLRTVPLAVDMSSNILSKPIPWADHNFGLIYAGAQKNIGPAGMTVVIVRRDLVVDLDEAVSRGGARVPAMMSYKNLADNASLYNTPPMFSIYVAGLVFKHLLDDVGGVEAMDRINAQKSERVYACIDNSAGFYEGRVARPYRSRMNIVFVCRGGEAVDARFVKEAELVNIKQVKGHRYVRAMYGLTWPLTSAQICRR
jgi:phosphoserine aminotransferase